jgi:hypothetical protein
MLKMRIDSLARSFGCLKFQGRVPMARERQKVGAGGTDDAKVR